MTDYGLSDEERRALRNADLKRLGELGVHPYFLPQVARLFRSAKSNHNESAAAQLYAYTRGSRQELLEEAHAAALPETLAVCDLAGLAEKPMPTEWRGGRRLGFEIRLRPVSRLLKPLPVAGERPFSAGD